MISNKKRSRYTGLLLICFLFILPDACCQFPDANHTESPISKISVLSIHVGNAAVHDSLFHFLTEILRLPVEYYPETYAGRWYAGVYAGNMFLEPCGPFSNFKYTRKNFKAIFFGVNCETQRQIQALARDLVNRDITVSQKDAIQVTDTALIGHDIFLNIAPANGSGLQREDSLRSELLMKNEENAGIEAISEIRIGYAGGKTLKKWKTFIEPSIMSKEGIWKINKDQSIRFVKSTLSEVTGIVFKVKSLEEAKAWLIKNNLAAEIRADEIEMDKSKTFGLSISIRE